MTDPTSILRSLLGDRADTIIETAAKAAHDALCGFHRDGVRLMGCYGVTSTTAAAATAGLAAVLPDLLTRSLPEPAGGCTCQWHNEDRGGCYSETVVEYEPACPEHSEHLYNPRTGMWEQPDPEVRTVGDLTARHIRSMIAVGDARPERLVKLEANPKAGSLGSLIRVWLNQSGARQVDADTPCKVVDA